VVGDLWATEVLGSLGVRIDAGARVLPSLSLRVVLGGQLGTSQASDVRVWSLRGGPELAWRWAPGWCLSLAGYLTSLAASAPASFSPDARYAWQVAGEARLDYVIDAGEFEVVPGLGAIVYPARRVILLDDERVLGVPHVTGSVLLAARWDL
jgi:hypothetical protein